MPASCPGVGRAKLVLEALDERANRHVLWIRRFPIRSLLLPLFVALVPVLSKCVGRLDALDRRTDGLFPERAQRSARRPDGRGAAVCRSEGPRDGKLSHNVVGASAGLGFSLVAEPVEKVVVLTALGNVRPGVESGGAQIATTHAEKFQHDRSTAVVP